VVQGVGVECSKFKILHSIVAKQPWLPCPTCLIVRLRCSQATPCFILQRDKTEYDISQALTESCCRRNCSAPVPTVHSSPFALMATDYFAGSSTARLELRGQSLVSRGLSSFGGSALLAQSCPAGTAKCGSRGCCPDNWTCFAPTAVSSDMAVCCPSSTSVYSLACILDR
jgi:hypothetical protein